MRRWMTVREAAERLGVSFSTIRWYIKKHGIHTRGAYPMLVDYAEVSTLRAKIGRNFMQRKRHIDPYFLRRGKISTSVRASCIEAGGVV